MDATISSIMTANPASCRPATPLREVAQMMVDHDCGQIPVVDEASRPIGVVTDRDIAVRLVARGGESRDATAIDIMSSPCRTVAADTALADCTQLMESAQIRRVPVVDAQGRLAGIVSIADIALAGRDRATAEVVTEVSKPPAH